MMRVIRNLDLAEIGRLLDWAADEGWNPGLDDAVAFRAADPTGFFGAFVGGTMVAGIAAVAYDAHFGFIGLYICRPDWRGQGHGKAVWDAGMGYLGNRTIGLDGVPEQQANYARMGFAPLYETVRMSGTLPEMPSPAPQMPALAEIDRLDRQCFPAKRSAFLQHWLAPPNRCVVRSAGVLTGYAVLRTCREGQKLGPCFAGSVEDATGLLEQVSGAVHIDVPAFQTGWLEILGDRGLRPGFRTARMYRGQPPDIALAKVFGITSLELG